MSFLESLIRKTSNTTGVPRLFQNIIHTFFRDLDLEKDAISGAN